jgi:hypothetical protein
MDVRETSASCCGCSAIALGLGSAAEAEPFLLMALNSAMTNGGVAAGFPAVESIG